jgi:hypothetical protein
MEYITTDQTIVASIVRNATAFFMNRTEEMPCIINGSAVVHRMGKAWVR